MKRESIPLVKRRKRGGERICKRTVEEGLYQAVQVIANCDILWVDEFPSNFSSYNEQVVERFNQHRKSSGLY